jgi:hypothetical protein
VRWITASPLTCEDEVSRKSWALVSIRGPARST